MSPVPASGEAPPAAPGLPAVPPRGASPDTSPHGTTEPSIAEADRPDVSIGQTAHGLPGGSGGAAGAAGAADAAAWHRGAMETATGSATGGATGSAPGPPTSTAAGPPGAVGRAAGTDLPDLTGFAPIGLVDGDVSFWRVAMPFDEAATDGGNVPIAGVRDPPPGTATTFHLRRLVGRGGMGEVWEAEQAALARPVAVKRIRADLDPATRRRDAIAFRQEALITARLEHPNVVPIYDYGRDAADEPLLAMKLVRGRPWHDLIREDEALLAPAALLARHLPILKDVGQAVAFAHARGIVHRDLKPAQVMVGEFGEVLLADWGLALAYDVGLVGGGGGGAVGAARDGDGPRAPEGEAEAGDAFRLPSPATASSPAGTPVFMAPEQTRPSARDIGPWTDVYLLGGILYFLLTRTYPHQAATREVAMALAAAGHVEPPAQRAPHLPIPAELGALATAAMQVDPARRVGSAAEFVRRLDDYLTGATRRTESEAIAREVARRIDEVAGARGEARYRVCGELLQRTGRARQLWPENVAARELEERALALHAEEAIRLRDFTLARTQAGRIAEGPERAGLLARIERGERRERVARLYLRASVAVIVLFAVVLGVVAVELRRQRDALDAALAAEAAQRRRAEEAQREIARQLELGEGVMSFMLTDLAQRLRPERRLELMEVIAREVLSYYDRQPDGLVGRGGRFHRAEALLEVSDVLVSDVAGEMDDAMAANEEAARIVASLLAEAVDDAERARLVPLLCDAHENLGEIWRRRGDLHRAGEEYQRVVRLGADLDAIGEVATGAFWGALGRRGLADAAADSGDLERSLAHRLDEIATWERFFEHRALIQLDTRALDFLQGAWVRVADTHMTRGDHPAAFAAMARARELLDQMLERGEPDWLTIERMVQFYDHAGGLAFDLVRHDEARSAFEQGVELSRMLVDHDPRNAWWKFRLATAEGNLGLIESFTDALAARARFERADEILADLLGVMPDDAELLKGRATNLLLLGGSYHHADDPEGAAPMMKEAAALFERLVELDPENLGSLEGLSHSWRLIAELEQALGRADEAERALRGMIAAHGRLVARDPGNARWASELSRGHLNFARLLERQHRIEEALAQYRLVVETRRALGELRPDYPGSSHWVLLGHWNAARMLTWRGRLEEATREFEAGLAIEHGTADPPARGRLLDLVAGAQAEFALLVAEATGDLERARAVAAEAVGAARRGRELHDSAVLQGREGNALRVAAHLARRAGDDTAAAALLAEHAAWLEALADEGEDERRSRRRAAALARAIELGITAADFAMLRRDADHDRERRAACALLAADLEEASAGVEGADTLPLLVEAQARLLVALGREADARRVVRAAHGRGVASAEVRALLAADDDAAGTAP